MAKQVWRLHKDTDTFIARCHKAKLYVLEASLGHTPSYFWRCIQQAKWVINKRWCWKFGNCNSVKIKRLLLIHEEIEESYIWIYILDGNYTVKSGYNAIRDL